MSTYNKRQAAAKAFHPEIAMSERIRHAIMLKVAQLSPTSDQMYVLQADQEVERMSSQLGASPCVTPRAKLWVTGRHCHSLHHNPIQMPSRISSHLTLKLTPGKNRRKLPFRGDILQGGLRETSK